MQSVFQGKLFIVSWLLVSAVERNEHPKANRKRRSDRLEGRAYGLNEDAELVTERSENHFTGISV